MLEVYRLPGGTGAPGRNGEVVGCRFGEGRLGRLVCRLYSEFVHLVQVNAKGV